MKSNLRNTLKEMIKESILSEDDDYYGRFCSALEKLPSGSKAKNDLRKPGMVKDYYKKLESMKMKPDIAAQKLIDFWKG